MQILVLGMHRSGTSAITRLISMMGAYFGPISIALPADKDNPKGFWERRDVMAINREILRLSGCVWHVVHQWNAHAVQPLPAQLSQHMQSIIQEMDAHPTWVLKDPRFCLTLPLWMPHLRQPLAVLAYRNPLEIAQSLHIRNGMPLEYALPLWEFHTVHAIRAAHALPKIFVSHSAIMQSPVAESRNIYRSLGAAGISNLQLPDEKLIHEFIDPELHRARGGNLPISLSPHQEMIAAMWRGEIPMDNKVDVSPGSLQILERWGAKISGSPL